jgi:hypothetical protein
MPPTRKDWITSTPQYLRAEPQATKIALQNQKQKEETGAAEDRRIRKMPLRGSK